MESPSCRPSSKSPTVRGRLQFLLQRKLLPHEGTTQSPALFPRHTWAEGGETRRGPGFGPGAGRGAVSSLPVQGPAGAQVPPTSALSEQMQEAERKAGSSQARTAALRTTDPVPSAPQRPPRLRLELDAQDVPRRPAGLSPWLGGCVSADPGSLCSVFHPPFPREEPGCRSSKDDGLVSLSSC